MPLKLILEGIWRDYTGKYGYIIGIEGRDFTDISIVCWNDICIFIFMIIFDQNKWVSHFLKKVVFLGPTILITYRFWVELARIFEKVWKFYFLEIFKKFQKLKSCSIHISLKIHTHI